MRRCLLLVSFAAVSLNAAPAPAGQGPLSRAIERDIAELTADPETPPTDWGAVRQLRRGQAIDLLTRSGLDGGRTLVHVDENELVVLNVAHPGLPAPAAKRLRAIALDHPDALLVARHRGSFTDRELTIGSGTISVAGRAVAALDEVVQTIPRDQVIELRLARVHGSRLGAIGGAAAGAIAAFAIAPSLAMKPCGGSCGGQQLLLPVSLVGLPVAGALLGYGPRRETVIVYKASQ